MAITVGGILDDPDSLDYEIALVTSTTTKELVIDTTNLKIKLTRVGNLTADGLTLRCLYSKLAELWISDSALTPFPFPIEPVTDEQFEFINGWDLDMAPNPTTKITVAGCSGVGGTFVINTTGNFNAANVFVGAYVSGTGVGTSPAPGLGNQFARVVSVDSNIQITVSIPNSGTVSGELTFWGTVDYTPLLVRFSGWALISTEDVVLQEWANFVSLGGLGEQGVNLTIPATAEITNSNVITVANTVPLVVGSYVVAKNLPFGARITEIISPTQFRVSKTISSLPVGALITIRGKDQPYFQVLDAGTIPAIMTGQVSQPAQIYGAPGYGDLDRRFSPTSPFPPRLLVRELGYTYDSTEPLDIGLEVLTYQTFRFPLSTVFDQKISVTDAEISINGITPTGSPYNDMTITWYAEPQARVIGGVTYYFSVIIDADTAATGIYGKASAEQIYEFVQWSLRRSTNINSGVGNKIGRITRELLRFQGDTLLTLYDDSDGGVFIDHFNETDINRIVFSDDTNNVDIRYPYISFITFTNSAPLVADGENARYSMFYKQINIDGVSRKFGNIDAILVKAYSIDLSGDGTLEIKGSLANFEQSVTADYDYDNNDQLAWTPNTQYHIGDEYRLTQGGVTTYYQVTSDYTSSSTWIPGIDAANGIPILGPTVLYVAVGRENGQYFRLETTINKSSTNLIPVTSQQELNYVE